MRWNRSSTYRRCREARLPPAALQGNGNAAGGQGKTLATRHGPGAGPTAGGEFPRALERFAVGRKCQHRRTALLVPRFVESEFQYALGAVEGAALDDADLSRTSNPGASDRH